MITSNPPHSPSDDPSRNTLSFVQKFLREFLYCFKNDQERHELRMDSQKKIQVLSYGNLAMVIFFVFFLLFYTTRQVFEDPNTLPLKFDDPWPTLFLQGFGELPVIGYLLDVFFSYYYVIGMLSLLIATVFTYFGEETGMWKYGLAFMVCWLMQYAFQTWIAFAVPIRVEGLPMSGESWEIPLQWIDDYADVRKIRATLWPASESLIGVKYGGMPSGHMGAPVMAYITAKRRNLRWLERYSIANGILIPITVIYLGEHYIIDLILSIPLYVAVYGGIVLGGELLEKKFGRAKNRDQQEFSEDVELSEDFWLRKYLVPTAVGFSVVVGVITVVWMLLLETANPVAYPLPLDVFLRSTVLVVVGVFLVYYIIGRLILQDMTELRPKEKRTDSSTSGS